MQVLMSTLPELSMQGEVRGASSHQAEHSGLKWKQLTCVRVWNMQRTKLL